MRENDDPEQTPALRSNDVGIFGLSRILYALLTIAGVFSILVKLMLNAEIANLRADMEKFRGEIRGQYVTADQVITRKESDIMRAQREQQVRELQMSDTEMQAKILALDLRVRDLERLNDQHGWKPR